MKQLGMCVWVEIKIFKLKHSLYISWTFGWFFFFSNVHTFYSLNTMCILCVSFIERLLFERKINLKRWNFSINFFISFQVSQVFCFHKLHDNNRLWFIQLSFVFLIELFQLQSNFQKWLNLSTQPHNRQSILKNFTILHLNISFEKSNLLTLTKETNKPSSN